MQQVVSVKKPYLVFNTKIGSGKPESIRNTSAVCPFCQRSELVDILAQEGSIIFLKNKYPVLEDTLQTVIIETDECQSELSQYPKPHLYRLLHFALTQWETMMEDEAFASVILYKNHGPFSGGTIRHPHMQIVGLKQIDYRANITTDSFSGSVIHAAKGVEFNLAEQPRVGFCELNICMTNRQAVETMADYLQTAAHYFLNHFHKNCTSYNVFFYHLAGTIYIKVMPRFVTSPLFVGYAIPQVTDQRARIVSEIQNIYFDGIATGV